MRTRRTISCLILAVYVVGFATPAFADPVETRHVTQVFTQAQSVPDIRLRELYTRGDLTSEEFLSPPTVRNETSLPRLETTVGMDLSILSLQQDPQKGTGGGTVETAICDCADLMVPVVGGFPKWPLIFLAGIPLIFLKGGEDQLPPLIPNPTTLPPTVTPTTTQTTIPEPTSLLLLLTGVGAVGMRLRRSRNREGKNDDV